MASPQYTIWTRTGTTWAELGTNTAQGIYVDTDSIRHTHNVEGGPESLSFTIGRDGDVSWPDLKVGQHVYCEVDGVSAWSGRINRTPRTYGSEDLLTVEAEGHWNHFSDTLVDRVFVHRKMDDWIPISSYSGVIKSEFNPDHEPVIEQRSATVPIPWGSHATTSGNGISLDLGPNNFGKYMACKFQIVTTVGTAAFTVYAVASDTPMNIASGTGNAWDVVSSVANPVGGTTYDFGGAIAGSNRRYLNFYYVYSGGTTTYGGNHAIRFWQPIVALSSSYVSYPDSILKASDVVSWYVGNANTQISTSTALISTSTTVLPEFPQQQGFTTPAEAMQSANKVEGYQLFTTPELSPRLTYRAKPTTPKYLLRSYDGDVQSGQSDDLGGLYNQVIVSYTANTGAPTQLTVNAASTNYLTKLGVTRTATLQAQGVQDNTSATALANAFLAEKGQPAFNGTVTVSGSIEHAETGVQIPVGQVTAGDVVRLVDIVDPTTGANGRNAVITGVDYNAKDNAATLTLDGANTVFDVLAARTEL